MGRRRLHPVVVGPVTAKRAGEPRRRGGLRRLDGQFTLRPGLRVAGGVSVERAFAEVIADWDAQAAAGTVSTGTVSVHTSQLRRFGAYLNAAGVARVRDIDAGVLHDWLYAPTDGKRPTSTLVKQRRVAVQAAYRTMACLGITDANIVDATPSVDAAPPVRRPCTATEITRLKHASEWRRGASQPRGATKGPATLALMLCGAHISEPAAVRIRDVALLDGRVWLSGHTDRYRPRWVPIADPWARGAFIDRIAYLRSTGATDDTYLTYRPGNPDSLAKNANRGAATGNELLNMVKVARLDQPTRAGAADFVRPVSITEYVARTVFAATGRVEDVANLLGMHSLDRVAYLLDYDWRTPPTSGPDAGSEPEPAR